MIVKHLEHLGVQGSSGRRSPPASPRPPLCCRPPERLLICQAGQGRSGSSRVTQSPCFLGKEFPSQPHVSPFQRGQDLRRLQVHSAWRGKQTRGLLVAMHSTLFRGSAEAWPQFWHGVACGSQCQHYGRGQRLSQTELSHLQMAGYVLPHR